MKCDLHIHTTYSDGKYSPAKVVKFAKDAGLTHIAITDHDTVCGIKEAVTSGMDTGVEIIPGIEFSTIYMGQDVHILGYFIDYTSISVQKFLSRLKSKREERAELIVRKLNELGYDIDFDRVREIASHGALGRPHIATALYEKGYTSTRDAAFYGLIGNNDPAYVPKFEVPIKNGIEFLKNSGAVVVLAHPGLIKNRELAVQILEFEFDGIEVYHPKHTEADTEFFREFALKRGLGITGGSDFHWFSQDIKIGIMDFDCECTLNFLYEKRRKTDVKQTG